jgi:hypothetical protein
MNIPKEKVQLFKEKIRTDPIWFVENILKNKLWDKEKEILLSIRDNTTTAVRSCHASGKSYTAARIVVWWLLANENSVVITTAPTFRQVKEILWREIRGCVLGKGLFDPKCVLETAINISSNWFALGLSSDRSDQFQGFHSPHLLVIVDEASGVSPEIYEAIDGLAPERTLLIGNPLKNTGRFADSFRFPNVKKIHISALQTPNILAGQRVIPGLITNEDIEKMKLYYGEDSDVFRVRALGEFPLQDSDSIIGVDEVSQAIQREVVPLAQWEKKMGVDPARFGDDRTVIVIRQMEKVIRKDIFNSLDTMQIAGNVLRIAKEERVHAQNINVDEVGIGAGIVDRLREQGWRVNGVNVGTKANDDEHYFNLRAELYADKVKNWLKTGSLTNDEDWYELANIKYKFDSSGRLQLEKKEDMKKRGLPSPDVADALMLTFANPTKFINVVATPPHVPYYGDNEVPY